MIEFRLTDDPKDTPVKFYTLKELGDLCEPKKTSFALKKLIYSGKIPDSNFRAPSRELKRGESQGQILAGARLYSAEIIVPKLIPLFNKISQGKAISFEVQNEICLAFEHEKQHFNT